ncbi:hypothetical protein BI032_gp273 [Citrobacter phage vB_CfrM_CfP1]|jgi:hypothetical protein|uniref:Uncharacterized protein n=1 Tax=Citrobacter phage vB_CfrM_CfP1 TaxID=1871313 RepID=A0A1B1IXU2_9CAUD|nr:hypothetical protein BI032_gp273 [Citrobacter phage vB_CfrM_CfP1]ANS06148.1 hypothetical protein ABCD_0076 [Citrobacter phage vB_CfrM_CfP1]
MKFEKIKCTYAFYDNYCDTIFYAFDTVPVIGHGEWAISRGGDVAYDLQTDRITQTGFPNELMSVLNYITDDIEIDGLEE